MKVNGTPYRSIWHDGNAVRIVDQRWLPHDFRIATLQTLRDFEIAIADMWVRGAPLIGATAAYGIAVEMARDASDKSLDAAWMRLNRTRPTAVNLHWALNRCREMLRSCPLAERPRTALRLAAALCEEDVEINRRIGLHGLELIKAAAAHKTDDAPVRILTHCNAGWLATVDWGTATSPIYQAADAGISLHVWVDETRPRNQGALTAWELTGHGVPHSYIVDNAGGHLMQHGLVDLIFVGTDRTTATGDVCNKIGTYLKALAAADNGVPFYVCLPSPTIDWAARNGLSDIPIEERGAREVTHVQGAHDDGRIDAVRVTPTAALVGNPAFDVTPARLVTGLITERGVCTASAAGLSKLFPEQSAT